MSIMWCMAMFAIVSSVHCSGYGVCCCAHSVRSGVLLCLSVGYVVCATVQGMVCAAVPTVCSMSVGYGVCVLLYPLCSVWRLLLCPLCGVVLSAGSLHGVRCDLMGPLRVVRCDVWYGVICWPIACGTV